MGDEETVPQEANWTEARAAERRLILGYAPAGQRPAVAALFELDEILASILRTTTEPAIAQMRLAWWHDALSALDDTPPRKVPVLEALAARVLPGGTTGAELASLVEGWDILVEEDLAVADTRRRHAEARARLFVFAAIMLGESGHDVGPAGRGWALADLAGHVDDAKLSRAAAAEALIHADAALANRWPRELRTLGAMAHQARMDARCWARGERPPVATPGRVLCLAWHRMSGR
ncbi:squalene/phytoene synthase family protein [Sphingomonas sp.]